MTRQEFTALQTQVRLLAMDIGLRAAARAMGISESRVQAWSARGKWNLARSPAISGATLARGQQPPATSAIEVKQRILASYSDRTRFGLAIAATNASETLAEREGRALLAPATAIAAQQWSKVADVTHGWTQERAQGNVTVNVANILPPTDQQDREREATHAKLDQITKLLSTPPPRGEGA